MFLNKKLLLLTIIFVAVFAFSFSVKAMTEAEKQTLIQQLQQQINALLAQVAQMQATQSVQPAQSTTASTFSCYTFSNNLGFAQSGNAEVSKLHSYLDKENISYSPDSVFVYGAGTESAVKQFQTKYGISGTGFVGAITRAKLNSLYGCATNVSAEQEIESVATSNNASTQNVASACTKDADCGTGGYMGSSVCVGKAIYQSYVTKKCNYPGTTRSVCTTATTSKVKETCAVACSGGVCKSASDIQSNTSTTDYSNYTTNTNNTTNTSTSTGTVVCRSDADCGTGDYTGNPICVGKVVYQNYSAKKCNYPGTTRSVCITTTTSKVKETCGIACTNGACSSGTSTSTSTGTGTTGTNYTYTGTTTGTGITTNTSTGIGTTGTTGTGTGTTGTNYIYTPGTGTSAGGMSCSYDPKEICPNGYSFIWDSNRCRSDMCYIDVVAFISPSIPETLPPYVPSTSTGTNYTTYTTNTGTTGTSTGTISTTGCKVYDSRERCPNGYHFIYDNRGCRLPQCYIDIYDFVGPNTPAIVDPFIPRTQFPNASCSDPTGNPYGGVCF